VHRIAANNLIRALRKMHWVETIDLAELVTGKKSGELRDAARALQCSMPFHQQLCPITPLRYGGDSAEFVSFKWRKYSWGLRSALASNQEITGSGTNVSRWPNRAGRKIRLETVKAQKSLRQNPIKKSRHE
jgi:hypothetical protein